MLDLPFDILSECTFSLPEIITAHDHRVSITHSFSDSFFEDSTLDEILDEVELEPEDETWSRGHCQREAYQRKQYYLDSNFTRANRGFILADSHYFREQNRSVASEQNVNFVNCSLRDRFRLCCDRKVGGSGFLIYGIGFSSALSEPSS